MKILLSVVCFGFLGLSFKTYNYVEGNDCIKQLKDIFTSMYQILPQKNATLYVNYEINTCYRNQTNPNLNDVKKLDIKLYSTETNNWFVSSEAAVYQDKEYTFTVIPSRKLIYWADKSNDGLNKEKRMSDIKKMQDTLFKTCILADCKLNKPEEKEIKMIPAEKYADLLQIEYVTYFLNPEKKQILKQHIEYTKHKKLKYVEYVFKEVNSAYKGYDISIPVKELFIDKKGSLNSTYGGYKLIKVKNEKKK